MLLANVHCFPWTRQPRPSEKCQHTSYLAGLHDVGGASIGLHLRAPLFLASRMVFWHLWLLGTTSYVISSLFTQHVWQATYRSCVCCSGFKSILLAIWQINLSTTVSDRVAFTQCFRDGSEYDLKQVNRLHSEHLRHLGF